jgi:hypothetical protein
MVEVLNKRNPDGSYKENYHEDIKKDIKIEIIKDADRDTNIIETIKNQNYARVLHHICDYLKDMPNYKNHVAYHAIQHSMNLLIQNFLDRGEFPDE